MSQDMNPRENPTEIALHIAARVWTRESTQSITMDTQLAVEFARVIDEYRGALIWCSGSADFGDGGIARDGFLKIKNDLIDGNGDL
jgi:hypothetical protein